MLEQLQNYIQKEKLFSPKDARLLLAVSGGADSMCLLHLLHTLSCKVAVAHCNFQLRAAESDADEQLVKRVCLEKNITFHTNSFNTAEYATHKSISIQMAARELRYNWFRELVQEYKYTHIATAHHLNDNVETLLLNLCKGTGINGLVGIAPKNGNIVRPLLFASKDNILEYCKNEAIEFREDASNADEKYERNYIRHTIIPALKSLNPDVENSLGRSINNFRFAQQAVNDKLGSYKSKLLKPMKSGFFIHLKQLNGYPFAFEILYQLLQPFSFNREQVKQIFEKQGLQTGREFHSHSHRAIKDRHRLLIVEKGVAVQTIELINESTSSLDVGNLQLKMETLPQTPNLKNAKPSEAYLNKKELQFPLMLRNWEPGDYFYPFGLGKKKKVARFLMDQKLSKPEKENVLVLVSGKRICWVVGHRIDDRFKVVGDSTVLKISYQF